MCFGFFNLLKKIFDNFEKRKLLICLHTTYFVLSEKFNCYKPGIYFDWTLKVLQLYHSVRLSVPFINGLSYYSPLQRSICSWHHNCKLQIDTAVNTKLFSKVCLVLGILLAICSTIKQNYWLVSWKRSPWWVWTLPLIMTCHSLSHQSAHFRVAGCRTPTPFSIKSLYTLVH